MKNKKKIVIALIQIVIMIVFVFSYKAYNDNSVKPVYVISYNRNIEPGVKITQQDLQKVPVSQATLNGNMFQATELSKIVGTYTNTKVYANNLAYKEQVGNINTVDKFASMDLSNKIVISLPMTLTEGVAGDFEAGDRVDILYSGTGESTNLVTGESEEFSYAKTFLRDIPVYQVNTTDGFKYVSRANVTPGEKYTEDDGGNAYAGELGSISLIVTPEQFEEIEARRNTGSIKISKRFEETENHETLGFVIGNYGKIFSGNANAETGRLQMDASNSFSDYVFETIPSSNTDSTSKNDTSEQQGQESLSTNQQTNDGGFFDF